MEGGREEMSGGRKGGRGEGGREGGKQGEGRRRRKVGGKGEGFQRITNPECTGEHNKKRQMKCHRQHRFVSYNCHEHWCHIPCAVCEPQARDQHRRYPKLPPDARPCGWSTRTLLPGSPRTAGSHTLWHHQPPWQSRDWLPDRCHCCNSALHGHRCGRNQRQRVC